jgi:hypothetical protein
MRQISARFRVGAIFLAPLRNCHRLARWCVFTDPPRRVQQAAKQIIDERGDAVFG